MDFIYILKTQGTGRIPDYIQLRDENFVLLTHTRADKPKTALETIGLGMHYQKIMEAIEKIPYGEMKKIEL